MKQLLYIQGRQLEIISFMQKVEDEKNSMKILREHEFSYNFYFSIIQFHYCLLNTGLLSVLEII